MLPYKRINLLFVGLAGSGKTYSIRCITGREGSSIVTTEDGEFDVELTEVNNETVENYFIETHAVVFCLDKTSNIEEFNKLFKNVYLHPKIKGKPSTVMTTKMNVTSDNGMEFDQIHHHHLPTKVKESGQISSSDLRREFYKFLKSVKKEFPILDKRVNDDIIERDEKNNDRLNYKTATNKSTMTSIGEYVAICPAARYPTSASKGTSKITGGNKRTPPAPSAFPPAESRSPSSSLKGTSLDSRKDKTIRPVSNALSHADSRSYHSSASKGTSINMMDNKLVRPVPRALLPADLKFPFHPPPINLMAGNTIVIVDSDHTASIGSSINLKDDGTARAIPPALLPSREPSTSTSTSTSTKKIKKFSLKKFLTRKKKY